MPARCPPLPLILPHRAQHCLVCSCCGGCAVHSPSPPPPPPPHLRAALGVAGGGWVERPPALCRLKLSALPAVLITHTDTAKLTQVELQKWRNWLGGGVRVCVCVCVCLFVCVCLSETEKKRGDYVGVCVCV